MRMAAACHILTPKQSHPRAFAIAVSLDRGRVWPESHDEDCGSLSDAKQTVIDVRHRNGCDGRGSNDWTAAAAAVSMLSLG